MTIKNFTNTNSTATLTFSFQSEKELKELKAISILYGNYNPLRKEMKENNSVLDYIDDYRFNRTSLEVTIEKIASQLI